MEGCKMERRKTMTMNWDGLRDDDDEFFESNNRISCFVQQDLASSDSDDEDFDDCRISFASTLSSVNTSKFGSGFAPIPMAAPMVAPVAPDYNIWMTSPGSIRERRQRLFQGMGLSSDKKILSIKRCITNKVPNAQVQTATEVPVAVTKVVEKAENKEDSSKQDLSNSTLSILFARSRSESEIESLSIEKKRKEELLGSESKQRLTRTSSLIISTLHAKLYPCLENIKASPKDAGNSRTTKPTGGLTSIVSKKGFGAFFLIKNLDTGKEFIVNEYDQDGMWNKLSDLQTGKKLTMEEFEKCVGYSPVVKELMRRENPTGKFNSYLSKSLKMSKKKSVAMLKSIKGVANSMTLRGEKEKEAVLAMEQKNVKNNGNNNNSQWVKVRQTGKSYKELSALHLCQEIQAHEGSIWTIKFSADARFLATAGEDKVIHVWEVQECDVMSTNDGSFTPGNSTPIHPSLAGSPIHPALAGSPIHPAFAGSPLHPSLSMSQEKKGKGTANKKGNQIPDYVHVPETVFLLSDRPVCSLKGHSEDVLDLSWSSSQQLLSSSMDKTVRLWDLETKSCLRVFPHSDYVTCINFNPVDEDHFISGSLDAKIRIWNIPARKVVDWTDLHEMVTAACYTPDGQGALIGTHNGSCRTYNTEDGKLTLLEQIAIQTKKVNAKKITGFQFCPINPTHALVTSADSRIRILDGSEVYYKFTGLRNANSQIAASFTSDGKYVVSASEDSQVFVWRREEPRNTGTGKRTVTNSRGHECFPCKDVSVAIPWPGTIRGEPPSMPMANSKKQSTSKRTQPQQTNASCESPTNEDSPRANNNKKGLPPLPKKNNNNIERTATPSEEELAQISSTDNTKSVESSASVSRSSSLSKGDSPSISAAGNLSSSSSIKAGDSPSISSDSTNPSSSSIKYGDSPSVSSATATPSWPAAWSWFDVGGHGNQPTDATAWGLVIVTATLGGEIRIYQNFGLPRKIGGPMW
ncbi:hypothetical protein PTKIN_Ptkin13bG0281700 [Pterospermum kingtungense]